MAGSILGSSVRRVEDPRLVTGQGRFVADIQPAGCLHAAFVRSAVAHGTIKEVELAGARAVPGVVGAFAAADLNLEPRLGFAVLPAAFARPPLATDRVRFVGEAVAVIVAESPAAAADGVAASLVDYGPLPALVDPEAAAQAGAALLFGEGGSNVAFAHAYGGDLDPLEGAPVVVRERFVNQRMAAVPMEPNGALAAPDPETGGLVMWASTQNPFAVRDTVAEALGLAERHVRVIAPDVGGGFGAKLTVYPEYVVIAALARRLGRPVAWQETRSENLVAMAHGRGQIQDLELGAGRDGRLVGMRVQVLADAGAYPQLGAFLPYFTGQMLAGVYKFPAIAYSMRSVATTTTPVGAYRGAGRPEAASLVERGMDRLALALAIDPAELRRRNLIPADAFPFATPAGATYDSGDYLSALELVLRLGGYDELRREQAARREALDSRLFGIGLSVYVEVTAAGSPTEYASAEVDAEGVVTVLAGTAAHGQGHATAFAQITSAVLGVPLDSVRVVEGDTGRIPRGDGTGASRSIQLGGSAVRQAALEVLDRGRTLAGHLLEADPQDIAPDGSGLAVRGVPGRGLSWAELAAAAADPECLPEGMQPGLAASADFVQTDTTYPFGAHLAVVEVDVETGLAVLLRHVAVDDCGTVVNPKLAEGQVHGGIAQGAGQAVFEEFVYDADGNPRSASLIDYALPSIGELPIFETGRMETPTPLNPLGAKGIGESATIGSTPAVQNAVIDALSHLGVVHVDMPLTPERVWRAIQAAPGSRAG